MELISRSSQLKTALTSEKLTENEIREERTITYLDANTVESVKLLKNNKLVRK